MTTYAFDDRALEVKIDGRVTPEAIEIFADALTAALREPSPFTVCFDRTTMTAVTKDGRVALARWANDFLPRLAGHCVGWADVYDTRRAASLANAAGLDDDAPNDQMPYPQRMFDDLDEARSWLRALLDERRTER